MNNHPQKVSQNYTKALVMPILVEKFFIFAEMCIKKGLKKINN